MPGKRIPDLPAIAGASTANDDNLVIYDTSEGTTKRILRSQLAAGIVGDLPYTPAGFIAATTVPTAIAEIASDLSASSGSSLVGFIQSGASAISSTAQTKLRETISVKDFGAIGDGVTDDTTAIQNAINYFSSGNGKLKFPRGTYLVTSGLTVAQNGVVLEGDGDYASRIVFTPSASGTAITFSKGAAVIYGSGLRSLWLSSGDTSHTKIGFKFSDASEAVCQQIRITNWTKTSAKDCIGIQTLGREVSGFSGLQISADIPINIGNNPNDTIDCNEFVFRDTYLVAADTQPCVKADDGVYFSGLTFEGYNSWVHGKYGFYYNNTTSAAANQKLTFRNIWKEQTDDATGYVFYIASSSGYSQNVTFDQCHGDTACKGYYLRRAINVVWTGSNCTSTSEALNVDGTVLNMTGIGFRTTSTATATLTDQKLMSALARYQGSSPVADTFTYQSNSSMGQASTNFGPITVTATGTAVTVAGANGQAVLDASETTNNVNVRLLLNGGATTLYNYSNHPFRFGTNNTVRFELQAGGSLVPYADNTYNLGSGALRMATIYAGTGTINTSDAREKQDIRELTEKERAVARKIKSLIRAFRFKNAVAIKGDNARIHFGVIAQEIAKAFEEQGLDAMKYGVICFDKWGSENRYGVRYEELISFVVSAL